jgi:GT2 family glycosyltransferase
VSPSVTAVVATHDEGPSLRRTVHGLLATLPADGEIVVVDDCSTDGSADFLRTGYPAARVLRTRARLGNAGARNLGANAARGDIVVFCDAHVIPQRGWFDAFAAALESEQVAAVGPAMGDAACPDVLGYGATWELPSLHLRWLAQNGSQPHETPLLGGAFLAMRRVLFEDCGGFDGGFRGWAPDDCELCARLWMLGYSCLVVPTVAVAHQFRQAFPYAVDEGLIVHNYLRIALVHLDGDRLERVIDHYRMYPSFARALTLLAAGDTYERRAAVRAQRRYDDRWFFERFGLD